MFLRLGLKPWLLFGTSCRLETLQGWAKENYNGGGLTTYLGIEGAINFHQFELDLNQLPSCLKHGTTSMSHAPPIGMKS